MRILGLDFGTTTSSAMLADVRVLRNCVTGRRELGDATVVFRGEPVFTPFVAGNLDEPRLSRLLDAWLVQCGVDPDQIEGGGAIVTGLAAQRANADCIRRLVRRRFGDSLIATADDPILECWLAFVGNCASLSRAEPATWLLNVDIGGGTTNLALGRDGDMHASGCYYIGARHMQLAPGGYRIAALSSYGLSLLTHLAIGARVGDELSIRDVDRIVRHYVQALERLVEQGDRPADDDSLGDVRQARFDLPADIHPVITFSGGVGELIYRCVGGGSLPGTTHYGDLGIELARRIVDSPVLARNLHSHVPAARGRATVCGLTLHNTEISGATVFLADAESLPLCDVPIVARLSADAGDAEVRAALEWAKAGAGAAALQISLANVGLSAVKTCGDRLARLLAETEFPCGRPLVLLVSANAGKALGQYCTGWGRRPYRLLVVDEVSLRRARFVSVGRPADGLVPVSYYGWE